MWKSKKIVITLAKNQTGLWLREIIGLAILAVLAMTRRLSVWAFTPNNRTQLIKNMVPFMLYNFIANLGKTHNNNTGPYHNFRKGSIDLFCNVFKKLNSPCYEAIPFNISDYVAHDCNAGSTHIDYSCFRTN